MYLSLSITYLNTCIRILISPLIETRCIMYMISSRNVPFEARLIRVYLITQTIATLKQH